MPRWLGQPGDWEHFADDVSQRVGGRDGSVVYGHTMWHLEPFYGSRAFSDEHAALWPRIKQAFVDREAMYGSSPELLNAFAVLATGMRDRQTAHDVLATLGDKWDLTLWQKRRTFDSFVKWAGSE